MIALFVSMLSLQSPAQSTSQKNSLRELLQIAESNYPLLKAKIYEGQARANYVAFAKSSAIPSLDAAYQVNYATYNNITGMATGQNFVPISGPPSPSNDYSGVFGTVGGLLLNWEPVTFGQRKAKIELAKAQSDYQQADADQEVFQHQVRTINAYLDMVMISELIRVYSKNVERSEDNLRIVKSLTRSGLRAGTDTALFRSELSRARIELLNFEKLKATQELNLSELLGGSAIYTIDSTFLTTIPVNIGDTTANHHPLITLSSTRIMMSIRERASLQRTLYPKLSLWGTAYARGSGIRYDNYVKAEDGLSFSRYNYGVGLVLSMPLLRFANVHHEVNAQDWLIKAEEERLNLTKLQLDKQGQLAEITLTNAIKVAHESPSYFESADFAYRTLKSRYNSGLVNYADLIQGQYALIKSEADLKRAYIDAWKALLFSAAVLGDINIFLNQLN